MTKDELKQRRIALGFTQEEMAKELSDTPVSTYRKWEQGVRKVPPLVDRYFTPKDLMIPGLSLTEIVELDAAARAQGKSIQDLIGDFIREGLKKGVSIILLALVSFQAFAPDDHQLVRKFGRGRRRDDIAAVEEIDTDGGEG